MKKFFGALCLMCVLLTAAKGFGGVDASRLNAPVPAAAKRLVARSLELAERDRFAEAAATLKKAIKIAPYYVNAHAEYINLKANIMERYDEARAEYEALMRKEPANPVYPMALAITQYQTSETSRNAWRQKVVELAPDWYWTHYAKGLLIVGKEPEAAVAEFNKYVEADGSWLQVYATLAFVQEKTLKRLDDAIATAEKAAARHDSRSWNLFSLWSLRLGKAGGSSEAKAALREELERLTAFSREIKILDAVLMAYAQLLNDDEKAKAVRARIERIDPGWYPERGRVLQLATRNASGVPRVTPAANRQFSLWGESKKFEGEMEAAEKIAGLEKLLASKPSPEMKRYLSEQIFKVAEKAEDTVALVKYGEILSAIDPTDAAVPAKIALAFANKKDSQTALRYAQIAERSTAVFRPVARPADSGLTDEEWLKEQFPEKRQQQHYKNLRALALDALGWSLAQAGRNDEAETHLKKSIETARSERSLFHLAEVLGRLGRAEEAAQTLAAAKTAYADALKKTFKNAPAKDFELTTIDGRRVKLSDLKGKVVMLDFWATWCGPCFKSMPTLNNLYAKYKERGFEILYISVDEQADIYKVAPAARENKLSFPVLFDAGAKAMYDVKAFPTTIFIDREGNVRHRDTGYTEESPRMLETVLELLLEKKS